ncbi:MAG: hypothetical protein ABSH52_34530 [Terriglobia bacterium]
MHPVAQAWLKPWTVVEPEKRTDISLAGLLRWWRREFDSGRRWNGPPVPGDVYDLLNGAKHNITRTIAVAVNAQGVSDLVRNSGSLLVFRPAVGSIEANESNLRSFGT